jgi:cytochrome c oxidase subunit I+III
MSDTAPPVAAPDLVPVAAAAARRAQEARLRKAWTVPGGWRYWSAVNNTVVGLWYILLTLAFFAFGGVLALVMRWQLAFPEHGVVPADRYDQIFTVHGSVMMFLFAIPIFEAVSIMFLPAILGARELPFPRLSAFGFWAFAIGGLFLCGSLLVDAAPRGGWFMYPPLTSGYQPDVGADIWLLGFSFIEVAAIAAAIELIVGVLRSRPPGMRLHLMPIYAWYVLVAAAMVLLAFPPLIAGTLLLELERAAGWPFFDPAGGGDPLLWQHLFWIFGHPEVYVIFLPSLALVAMMVPTLFQRPLVGYGWIVIAAVSTGVLSFGLWVHHMFTTGLPGVTLALFSGASAAVAVPTSIQFFCLVATMLAGRAVRSVPLLYVVGGLASFVIGGLTGVMLAMAPFDFQAHDTFFVVAHLHTVVIAGSVFPLLAGLYYYYPLVSGRLLSERLGRTAFWLVFVGFNLTFLPMHVLGLLGMPRRVFTYPPGLGWDHLNLAASIGAAVLALGLVVIAVDLCRPSRTKRRAPRNPWNAGTLEWLPPLDAPPWGMRTIPAIDARYPLWRQPDLVGDYDAGRFYLADAEEGRREMLITSTVDAVPRQCLRIPGPSFVPLMAAVFVGGVFVCATFKLYGLAAASGVLGLGAILIWLWTGTGEIPEKPAKDIGLGVTVPLYLRGRESVGWWAMAITMLSLFTAFVSIVFGYVFYWTLDARFLDAATHGPDAVALLAGGSLSAAAWTAAMLARRWNRQARRAAFYGAAGAASAGAGSAGWAFWASLTGSALDPTATAYAAIVWVLVVWSACQIGLTPVMHGYCAARRLAGRLTPDHDLELDVVAVYWHFTLATVAVTVAVVAGFPRVG